jgi:TolB-like protein
VSEARQPHRKSRVDYYLDGIVLVGSDHLRATARLIRASDSTQIWAHIFEKRDSDPISVQFEVADSIARSTVQVLVLAEGEHH